jgi:hypothetical protein
MENEDGYTIDSIRYDLEDKLDIDRELIHTIVWTEQASINTMRRVSKYLHQFGSDEVYKLQVPDDDRTHIISKEAAEEIEQKGALPMQELARILLGKAEEHKDVGGTPERMEQSLV